jgi:hypothetical protein
MPSCLRRQRLESQFFPTALAIIKYGNLAPNIKNLLFEFSNGILLSLRSHALAVTLSGFAGGETLPFPRSKGGAFPFLLTVDGCPTASANVAQGQKDPRKSGTSSLLGMLIAPCLITKRCEGQSASEWPYGLKTEQIWRTRSVFIRTDGDSSLTVTV